MSCPARWSAAFDALINRRDTRPFADLLLDLLHDRPPAISMPMEFAAILSELLHAKRNFFDAKLVVEDATYARTELQRVALHAPRIEAIERHLRHLEPNAGKKKTLTAAIAAAAAELDVDYHTLDASWKKYRKSFGTLPPQKPKAKTKKPIRKQLPKSPRKAAG
jgi:hypothetical protein